MAFLESADLNYEDELKIDNTFPIFKSYEKLAYYWDIFTEDFSILCSRFDDLISGVSNDPEILPEFKNSEREYTTEVLNKLNSFYDSCYKHFDILLDKCEDARDVIEKLLPVNGEMKIENDIFRGREGGFFDET